ncbi:unnamed protein product [Bursaphelenchus xylophilus]|uniref:(pine wood nematode) hypothetical protein n=1 Tax=Bursaphelenchus xylophilus TaxID=6326 RepID=A0A1I7SJB0_BURXY|nr:unnamed protein product [Bursaphelenchus xylophilus]CAG9092767.1 unnamed protein product [Bursaphelenchus xylophilus]
MALDFGDNFVFVEYLDVWGPRKSVSPSLTSRPSSADNQTTRDSFYSCPSDLSSPCSTPPPQTKKDSNAETKPPVEVEKVKKSPNFTSPSRYMPAETTTTAQTQGNSQHRQSNFDVCFCKDCMSRYKWYPKFH